MLQIGQSFFGFGTASADAFAAAKFGGLWTTPQQKQFDRCFNLTRPPLSDDEIRLMPPADVISLYYRLHQLNDDGCGYKVNPEISAWLPASIAHQYEIELQQRIYTLRNDLQFATDTKTGKKVPILVEQSKLPGSHCTDVAATIAVGIVGLALSAFGGWVLIAYEAATIAMSIAQTVERIQEAQQLANLLSNVQAGVSSIAPEPGRYRPLTMPGPPWKTTDAMLSNLSKEYDAWQSDLNTLPCASLFQFCPMQAPAPEYSLCSDPHIVKPRGVSVYEFIPYTPYFYSGTVASMVMQWRQSPVKPGTVVAVQASVPQTKALPVVAAGGIGLLMLLAH